MLLCRTNIGQLLQAINSTRKQMLWTQKGELPDARIFSPELVKPTCWELQDLLLAFSCNWPAGQSFPHAQPAPLVNPAGSCSPAAQCFCVPVAVKVSKSSRVHGKGLQGRVRIHKYCVPFVQFFHCGLQPELLFHLLNQHFPQNKKKQIAHKQLRIIWQGFCNHPP